MGHRRSRGLKKSLGTWWNSQVSYSKQNQRPPKYYFKSTWDFSNQAKIGRKLTMWPCPRVVATWLFENWVVSCFMLLFWKVLFLRRSYLSQHGAALSQVSIAGTPVCVQSTGPWSAACRLRPWSVHGPRPKNVRQPLSCERVELNMSTGRGPKQFLPRRWFNTGLWGRGHLVQGRKNRLSTSN